MEITPVFQLTPIFVLLIIFGTIFGIVYLGIRKRERMAFLEKGVDISKMEINKQTSATSLKYGLLLIGIAVGLLLGDVLSCTTDLQEEVAYFSMVFIFGGLALVIFHFIDKKNRSKSNE